MALHKLQADSHVLKGEEEIEARRQPIGARGGGENNWGETSGPEAQTLAGTAQQDGESSRLDPNYYSNSSQKNIRHGLRSEPESYDADFIKSLSQFFAQGYCR